jgi:hypothetical protein
VVIDTVSEVANANVSQTDRVNLKALAFKTCRLYKPNIMKMYNMHNMYNMQNTTQTLPLLLRVRYARQWAQLATYHQFS